MNELIAGLREVHDSMRAMERKYKDDYEELLSPVFGGMLVWSKIIPMADDVRMRLQMPMAVNSDAALLSHREYFESNMSKYANWLGSTMNANKALVAKMRLMSPKDD
jgi:hypothetical protein